MIVLLMYNGFVANLQYVWYNSIKKFSSTLAILLVNNNNILSLFGMKAYTVHSLNLSILLRYIDELVDSSSSIMSNAE